MLHIDTSLKDELKQFVIIAIPLSAAYLAEFAMFLTTKMVVGKLGYRKRWGLAKKDNWALQSGRVLSSPLVWVSRRCC
jgi:hypothetical protein